MDGKNKKTKLTKTATIDYAVEVFIASREPLLTQGIDIGAWQLEEWLTKEGNNEQLTVDKPLYLLWNNGDVVANDCGGLDVIAMIYLDKDGKTVRGWSR